MLDVGRLRVLLAVHEHGGLTPAARALGATPPEVVEQIAGLERQLGVPLIDGDPRGSRLTPAGRRLAGHAGKVLADLEAAGADAAAVVNRASGMLQLATTASAGRVLLPAALAALRGSAPELDLRVGPVDGDEALPGLVAGDLDVAVIGEYGMVPRRESPDTERRDLLIEPLVVAVPVRHPVTSTGVRLSELRAERWISAASGPARDVLVRACGVAGFAPNVVAEAADDMLALALVAAGHGVALLPVTAARLPGAEGMRMLAVTDNGVQRTIAAVTRRSSNADPAVGRVLDALGAAARRLIESVPGVRAPSAGPGGIPLRLPDVDPAELAPQLLEHGQNGTNGVNGILPPVSTDLPRRPSARDPLTGPRNDSPDPLSGPGGLPFRSPGRAPFPGQDFPAADAPADLPRANPFGPDPLLQGDDLPSSNPPSGPPSPTDLPFRTPGRSELGRLPDEAEDLPRRPTAPTYPVSPDLSVRALTSAELPLRPPSEPPPGRPTANGDGTRPPTRPGVALPPRPRNGNDPSGTGSFRRTRLTRSSDPLGTLPPAPPGADDDVRLSIFEELQSEWFASRGSDENRPSWDSPADDGWRAAAKLAEPATAGTTTSGLPKRVPQALLLPGAVGPTLNGANGVNGLNGTNGTRTPRSPQDVRGRLASYRDGVRRGRHAERPRDDPNGI